MYSGLIKTRFFFFAHSLANENLEFDFGNTRRHHFIKFHLQCLTHGIPLIKCVKCSPHLRTQTLLTECNIKHISSSCSVVVLVQFVSR